MIQIYKVEVSLNGRDHIINVMETNYRIKPEHLGLVRRVLINSFSEEMEEEVYVYLHQKELKK